MSWLFDNLSFAAIGGCFLYGLYVLAVSRRRNRGSRCARCGAEIGHDSVTVTYHNCHPEKPALVEMCPECATRTERHHGRLVRLFEFATAGLLLAKLLDMANGWLAGSAVQWSDLAITGAACLLLAILFRGRFRRGNRAES